MSRRRRGRRPARDDQQQVWPVLSAIGSIGRFVVEGARALADGLIDRLGTVVRGWLDGGPGV